MKRLFVVIVGLGMLALACGSPSDADIQAAIAETAAANSSGPDSVGGDGESEQVATLTPLTPLTTPEPEVPPTDTPEPTETPVPTPEPEPITLSGSGDSVVDIEWPESVGIMHIVGNAGSTYFGVIPHDATGDSLGSLVNTTDVYDGVVIFNTRDDRYTTRLEILSSGEWIIEVLPLSRARILEVPGTIEGVGDEIIVLSGSIPDLANIVGNASGSYFGVVQHGPDGDSMG